MTRIEAAARRLAKAGRVKDEKFHEASLAREAYRRREQELRLAVAKSREKGR